MNHAPSRSRNGTRLFLAAAMGLALFHAAGARGAAAAESLRSDTLRVDISDQGLLTNIRLKDVPPTRSSSGDGQAVGAWYRADEPLAIVPTSVRRSASGFEAELAPPLRGRLVYSLSGSLLTLEIHGSDGALPSPLRFELPNDSVSLGEEDRFVGMAGYLNGSRPLRISAEGEVEGFDLPHTEPDSPAGQWIGRKSRYFAALISAPDAAVSLSEDGTVVEWKNPGTSAKLQIYLVNPADPSNPANMGDVSETMRYAQLWWGFRYLCIGVEWVVLLLYGLIGSWGVAIIATSVILRVVLIPINRKVAEYQKQVNSNLSILEPQLAEIKRKYKGAQASEAIMAAHKALGISPFHTMKPMLGLMVQLPVLIAIFNVFGELEAVRGYGFLWIADLSYPDAIAHLPFAIPLFGDGINLLPILMTVINLIASAALKPPGVSEATVRSQRRGLYFMAAAFFLLFFTFPASMVLFWTTSNFLQFIQQTINQRKQASE